MSAVYMILNNIIVTHLKEFLYSASIWYSLLLHCLHSMVLVHGLFRMQNWVFLWTVITLKCSTVWVRMVRVTGFSTHTSCLVAELMKNTMV